MASSNRHWPSMFKSKPCNPHHQWQHDINSSFKAPYTSVPGCEERSPEPKPRWNPKPEQIRILEAIFNSGMVNPPRDEIRKIRTQLQEYGQVGDANVFYWFQNRKSRSKHKQRHLQTAKSASQTTPAPAPGAVMTSSSSSSSEKSSPRGGGVEKALSVGSTGVINMSNSPTGSVNQTYFQPHGDYSAEPFFFQVQTGGVPGITQGFCFPELSNFAQIPEQALGHGTGMLSELISLGDSKRQEEMEKMKIEQHLSYTTAAATSATTNAVTTTTTAINDVQGAFTQSGVARSTVFINGVAFEVAMGPLNLREVFGDDAVLLHSSGQPVLTNEWGVTLHSLQHGASYYLV